MRATHTLTALRTMSTSTAAAATTTPALKRVPISALPLTLPTHSLIHALTPDPHTPTPAAWRTIRMERPSLQRRARLLAPSAHFSYVAPCPVPFPYRVEYPEDADGEAQVKAIEGWMVEREALREEPTAAAVSSTSRDAKTETEEAGEAERPSLLRKYVAEKRDGERVLIGLAETGLRDCVPHLDVGDAFGLLGTPSLSVPSGQDAGAPNGRAADDQAIAARRELIDVLSGHATLMNGEGEDAKAQWAPWSLRYSGHQFGTWAGQLGDGRAISLREFYLASLWALLTGLSERACG